MSDLLPKIKELMDWSGLGPAAFADEIGVARPVMSHILSARNKVSLEVVQKLLARFEEVNPLWLLLGNGEMLREVAKPSLIQQQIPAALSPEDSAPHLQKKVELQEKVQGGEESQAQVPSGPAGNGRVPVKVIVCFSDGTFEIFNQL
ncbi:helix-turn-helix domain-containing protein [Rufibacter ruber]|uniref:helix-turn-helix domain-containing protein n=1 Tax=Rufibacter ruber TaxID=1783499 RepID=UPI000A59C8E2|nr:helix-turn-helix transcriptional regulator [Rufibacter ruber]